MTDKYDFGNLSPIEFETICIDLLSSETGLKFESFSEGADRGIDGRHSSSTGNIILQAKHYKNSTWSNLKTSAKGEVSNIKGLSASFEAYYQAHRTMTTRGATLYALAVRTM